MAFMTDRMSTKDYLAMVNKPKSGSKYKNVKVEIDGIKFDSKAEGAYYSYLLVLQDAGEVSHFLMQVPFLCGGGVKYRLDFLVFYASGLVDYIDIKGAITNVFAMKRKQVEARYPVKIRCLKKSGNRFVET